METSLMFQLDFISDIRKVNGQGLDSVTSCATYFIALVSGLPSKHEYNLNVVCQNLEMHNCLNVIE